MLTDQLRESSGFLADAGWGQTARLIELAADEIERLTAQLAVERARTQRKGDEPTVTAFERLARRKAS